MANFAARSALVIDLAAMDRARADWPADPGAAGLARRSRTGRREFAFLMVDGLSTREDELAAALASGLGPVPLFGGSAADGTRFRETFVLQDGQVLRNAAVLTLVRTACTGARCSAWTIWCRPSAAWW
ncbi:MAG: FIST N-terminal domain-containing protein [Gemmobacter sp.]|nr:FIST N-terminal domain-containing protein [Gemmobacter sp.]